MINGLSVRIASGFILCLAVVLTAFWMPSTGDCILLVTISTLALLEFYHLLDLTGIPCFRIIGVLFGILIIASTWILSVMNVMANVAEWEMFLLTALVITILIRQFPQKLNVQPVATIACTLLGILYVPFLFNYLTKLLFSWESPGMLGCVGTTGRILFFYLICVVKFSDIGAYVIGSHFGRHRLIPRISPGKTWEGCGAGIGCGLIMSLVFFWIVDGQFGSVIMTSRDALILGVLLPLFGMVGDLTESMLKRAAGVKDSGIIIPGMGGVLDVLDSLLFAVPVFYIYVKYILA